MSLVFSAVRQIAKASPDRVALIGTDARLSFQELEGEVDRLCRRLMRAGYAIAGLLLDNCPAWSVIDFAVQQAGIPLIPVPAFFSKHQLIHILRDAGVDVLFTELPETGSDLLATGGFFIRSHESQTIAGRTVHVFSLAPTRKRLQSGISKITYTSGTTGAPKGVCLQQTVIDKVAYSLVNRADARPCDRHLSFLPLATLLENVGGVYVPLLAGATCCLPALRSVGIQGAAHMDVSRVMKALEKWQPSSTIVTPQMLQRLVETVEQGVAPPLRLRFVAVGGAPVSERLLRRAEACGLPAYEGYGLSECASVVAVNGPGQRRIGSVGRPLPHVRLELADDGEIRVDGAAFSGYLGGDPVVDDRAISTGDLGRMDKDGYLYITGRKKNMFVTSYGRNIAPEWIERELTLYPDIVQAAVFGEGRPWNVAVVVPAAGSSGRSKGAVKTAIAKANAVLPDYARVSRWIMADAPFSQANGQLTTTGRVRREAVWTHYGTRIRRLYPRITQERSP